MSKKLAGILLTGVALACTAHADAPLLGSMEKEFILARDSSFSNFGQFDAQYTLFFNCEY
jgi:hypothetical protein